MKKYNDSTGCYKIDIYVCGRYACSTDMSKTCKEAKTKYLSNCPSLSEKDVKCIFYRD